MIESEEKRNCGISVMGCRVQRGSPNIFPVANGWGMWEGDDTGVKILFITMARR